MNLEVQSTLQRLTAKESETEVRKDPTSKNTVTNSFFHRAKPPINEGIRIDPDCLLSQLDAELILGKKVIGVKGNADDLTLVLEGDISLHISICGDTPVIKTTNEN